MIKKSYVYSLFLVLASAWWAWTFLVDIFIIPTVFRSIDNFFQAGDLGIAVFSKLNTLEVLVSSVLLGMLAWQTKKNKKTTVLLVTSVIVWAIALTYFFYLTPKLITLTDLWKQMDLMGLTSAAEIPDIQQEHQFYHNLYIRLDMLKLFLLSFLIGFGIWKQDKWS